jgi:hypothetical protein
MIYDYILYIAFINDSLEIYEFEGHHNFGENFEKVNLMREKF